MQNEYDLFRKNPIPANAVRLALANFIAVFGPEADTQFTSALRRAAMILDAFETHRFALDSALKVAANETGSDQYSDAHRDLVVAINN